jgi:hypothetical protein
VNGYAAPGATETFYQSGTDTLITVYLDEPGTVVSANPVTADASGFFPQVYANVTAKAVVRDAGGATLWTIDPVPATSNASVGARNVSFSPTVDIPETNVQDAIETAATFAASGFTAFGLGNAGNAPTIAALDSGSTETGMWRFTGSTTGTFPTGVTAATTGLVTVDRQTSSEAMMMLRPAGSNRLYVRFLASFSWGSWREIPAPLVPGSANALQTLRLNAAGNGQEYSPNINVETAVSLSGQTSVDFTGIPTAARRITLMLIGVSTSGTAPVLVRIGDSGGFENTGYAGACTSINGATAATTNPTASFEINFGAGDTAAASRHGKIVLDRATPGGVGWVASGIVTLSNTNATSILSGRKDLSDVLDRVRIIMDGVQTFDAGVVNVSWEV